MRIAWYSNAPNTPTGYGTQTKQILKRLKADGHHIEVLGNYGHVAGTHDAGFLAHDEGLVGISVWPQGPARYSLDVVDEQCSIIEPDYVFTLYDVWTLRGAFANQRVVSWTPVDHYPVPVEVAAWAQEHRTLAMSKFGQAALKDSGIESTYVPHGIEPAVYKPTPSDFRRKLKVPDDAFLVMICAANVGKTPPRKAWDANIQGFAALAREHKDAYLYIHTDLTRPDGVPIPRIVKMLNIPPSQVRMVPQLAYRNGLVEDTDVAEMYTAADVLLSASMGEGFGLPVVEAMACGTPAIVTDFSAQPELVGDTGWKVRYQPFYNENHHAYLAMPFVGSIHQALEEAYQERGTQKATDRSAAAIAKAQEYDADTVYAEKWRPLLAQLEADLRPFQRKGMSKAARRRMKK